jgi:hypothetical protein
MFDKELHDGGSTSFILIFPLRMKAQHLGMPMRLSSAANIDATEYEFEVGARLTT